MKPSSIFPRLCWRPFPVAVLAAAWAAILAVLPSKLSADDAAAAPAAAAAAPKPPPPPGPLTWIFSAPGDDEVLDSKLREKLLTFTEHNLNRAEPDALTFLQAATDPFFIKPPPPPPPSIDSKSNTGAVDAPPPPPSISDAERLQQVADSLDATGILILTQSNRVLETVKGPLRAGAVIVVAFPGDAAPSKIVIDEIGVNTYSLKLNDTVLPNIKPTTTAPDVGARQAANAKMNPPAPPPAPAAPAAPDTPAAPPAPGSSPTSAPPPVPSPAAPTSK